jgi:hypothetical protein
MSAEAEISNSDTERFIVEVHPRIALWDMTTEAYSNTDLKKKSQEKLVDIFMSKVGATATMCRKYLSLIDLLRLGVRKISVFTAFTQAGEQKIKAPASSNSILRLTHD